jgi:spermidine synthase
MSSTDSPMASAAPAPARPAFGRLELIAFLSGAIVMVLEITGSRVLAPFLGTSVFVWTTLIGIIMASLSLGYWWGGRLADQAPTRSRLAAILFAACLFATATAVLQSSFLSWLQQAALELRTAALLATLVLFAPASTLLGMVTPYIVRLKLTALEHSGADVGRLYAISTAGSIVGTFACGYFLLAWMGTSRILYALAFLLLALSFVAAAEFRVTHRAAAAMFLLLSAALAEFETQQNAKAGFVDLDTSYQRLQVVDAREESTGRPVRLLKAEEANTQSAIYLDGDELLTGYLIHFDLARFTGRPLRRVLMIGAAGCAYPMALLRAETQIEVDVVELDPAMTVLAKRYFGLPESPRLRVFHEDGRTFVNRLSRDPSPLYDAIFIDAFQTRVPPFQLLTAEFVASLERILAPQGLVALNLIARTPRTDAGLAPSVFATFSTAFPALEAFVVDPKDNPEDIQNLVLFASRTPVRFDAIAWSKASQRPLPHRLEFSNARGLVLTDDFAPVEHLVSVR